MRPGTHYIYAYALDNGGIGLNPLLGNSPLSYTVASNPAPTCSSAAPQASSTTLTSGTFWSYQDLVDSVKDPHFL